jgi:tetratricopeptide (TPR) repeat protein
MHKERKYYGSRRSNVVRWVSVSFLVALLACAAILAGVSLRNRVGNAQNNLLALWEQGAYAEAFDASGGELTQRPMDYLALTIRGFSAYQLGIAQINNSDTLKFIDECVWSLRKALLTKRLSNLGELYYVLGKAYYHKGPVFADLAVEFLEKALALDFQARDISEFLGLSYANIRDYRASVAAFTLALDEGSSDLLLISIARSYMILGEGQMAKPYILRGIETSRDSQNIVAARLLYAEILMNEGNSGEAESQYQLILDETGGNAEAYYQIGELYAARGDTTRARAEWRRAIRIDPAHKMARQRLNM